MERHADPLDRASDFELETTEAHISEARRAAAPEQDPDNLVTECADCGEAIEPGRLIMFKRLCFSCQIELEKRRKQYGR